METIEIKKYIEEDAIAVYNELCSHLSELQRQKLDNLILNANYIGYKTAFETASENLG